MAPTTPDANLRDTVLAAAIDIVQHEGVGALSMREIGRAHV